MEVLKVEYQNGFVQRFASLTSEQYAKLVAMIPNQSAVQNEEIRKILCLSDATDYELRPIRNAIIAFFSKLMEIEAEVGNMFQKGSEDAKLHHSSAHMHQSRLSAITYVIDNEISSRGIEYA